jgi:hypothetical protein
MSWAESVADKTPRFGSSRPPRLAFASGFRRSRGGRPHVSKSRYSPEKSFQDGAASIIHSRSVQELRNTHVSEVHAAAKGIAWAQTDEALPMPVDRRDALVALVLKSSDFTEALNQEPLAIRGLASGRYTLKIDGEAAGSFTSSNWRRASIWRNCRRR